MKKPDEIQIISVQEHLKIVVTERKEIGNITSETIKTVINQRVK